MPLPRHTASEPQGGAALPASFNTSSRAMKDWLRQVFCDLRGEARVRGFRRFVRRETYDGFTRDGEGVRRVALVLGGDWRGLVLGKDPLPYVVLRLGPIQLLLSSEYATEYQ